jgi:hypothetical protein
MGVSMWVVVEFSPPRWVVESSLPSVIIPHFVTPAALMAALRGMMRGAGGIVFHRWVDAQVDYVWMMLLKQAG